MPSVKYDVSDIEVKDGDYPLVPRGVYPVKVKEAEFTKSSKGNPMFHLQLEITKRGEYKGVVQHFYATVTGEDTDFQFAAMVKALGMKASGTINDGTAKRLVGKKCSAKIKHETYEEEPRSKIATLMPLAKESPADEPEDDEDEGTDEDLTLDDLLAMDLDDLKEIIEEEELDIRVTKRSKVETVANKIAEEMELDAGDDDDDDDDDENEGDDADELTADEVLEMDLDELKEVIEEEELEIRVTKRSKPETIAAKVIEALELEEPDDDEDEDDEDEEEDDYDEWSPQELKDELKSRELKVSGKKSILIARLRKDDEDEEDPF